MRLVLADTTPDCVQAWSAQFLKRPEVEIRESHVFDAEADAFLLPGNSFGFLDSGLALEACERFGWDLQEEVRRMVRTEFSGELLVGQAVAIRMATLPTLVIYAPLWRTPRKLEGTVNAYLALRGASLALSKAMGLQWPLELTSPGVANPAHPRLAVPALGVKEGGLDPRISARQIRYAYEVSTGQRGFGDKNLTQQARRERKLLLVPGIAREDGEDSGE